MSLHLGIHWGMMMKRAGRRKDTPSAVRRTVFRLLGAAVAVYGAYAFWKRGIGSYLLMQVHFVFFDYAEPVVFFLLDYVMIMGLFVWAGHYLGKLLRKVIPSG